MTAAGPNLSARIERVISNVSPSSPPRLWIRGVAMALLIPPFTIAAARLEAPGSASPQVAAATPAVAQTAPSSASDTSPPFVPPWVADPSKPHIVEFGDLELRKALYPADAKRLGVEGIVTLTVTLDSAGRVVGTLVVDEFPNDMDYGFGAAASHIAHVMKFANPTKRQAQLTFRVKFDLDDKPGPPGTPVTGAPPPAASTQK